MPHGLKGPIEHPALLRVAASRHASVQLRLADWITAFAGSMRFVYLHIVVFAVWMLFGEGPPWPTLTLWVSLEAIFLTSFVMIGQNRQAAIQQVAFDHDYAQTQADLAHNTELTESIKRLTESLMPEDAESASSDELPDPLQT